MAFGCASDLPGDDLGIHDQVIAFLHAGARERLALLESLPALLVVQAVAHRRAVRSGHRKLHLRDDVRDDLLDLDRRRNLGLDALGARLVEERDLDPFAFRHNPSPWLAPTPLRRHTYSNVTETPRHFHSIAAARSLSSRTYTPDVSVCTLTMS